MKSSKSFFNLKAGPSSGMATASSSHKASLAASRRTQPMRPQPSGPILVVATVDSEYYAKVDITNTLDDGAIIRKRILEKVCFNTSISQAL
jgi:hypothetical protein